MDTVDLLHGIAAAALQYMWRGLMTPRGAAGSTGMKRISLLTSAGLAVARLRIPRGALAGEGTVLLFLAGAGRACAGVACAVRLLACGTAARRGCTF